MELSVIIATKDRDEYLRQTLASLLSQRTEHPFEIIVVDNGSSDATPSVVAAYADSFVPVRYVAEPKPNRAKARNRGVAVARASHIVFCDDDVQLPEGWLAGHAAAHGEDAAVVNGPIVNVQSYRDRPLPRPVHYSRAFLCSCNVSLPKRAFVDAGGFDEQFELYGWEDTELGLRLRQRGLAWKFVWAAYLWHIKPFEASALSVETRKAAEKARMAALFVAKHPSSRARLATGAHALNLLRGRYLLPQWLLALYAGVATSTRFPAWAVGVARAQLLDGVYTRELARTIDGRRVG